MPALSMTEKEENLKRKPSKTILDSFSHLLNPQEGVRLKGTISLLKYLGETSNEEKKNELDYAIGRIIRGLGSSAVNAKAGFYSTLIALLDIQKDINLDKIFSYLQKELHKSNSFSKGENADVAAGQILACGAVIRSQNWLTLSDQDREKIFTFMLKASKERSYLGLLCYKFVIIALHKLQDEHILKLFPLIASDIDKPWNEQNLDTLYLLLSINSRYPQLLKNSLLNKLFESDGLICDQNLDELSRILLTIPKISAVNHPVFELISKDLASSELLKDFITHMDSKVEVWNRNKMLVLTNIYTLILTAIIKTSAIPSLLSNNFIKHILNYFKTFNTKQNDVEFKKCVYKFFDQLVLAVKRDQVKSKTKILILKKLLFSPGVFIFEKITKSKIIQHLTTSLDNDGVKNLAVLYTGVIEGSDKADTHIENNEKWINTDRLYATHLLIKLFNHPAVKNENQWKIDRLCFLINLGFFTNNELNIGCELSASLRTAFYGALNLKLTKLEDLLHILVHLIYHISSKLTADNYKTVLKNPISEADFNTWQTTVQTITKIDKKKNRSNLKIVFLTLFVTMGLQLLNDSKLATDSLNELFICYEKTRKSRKNSVNPEDNDFALNQENNHDPLWIEVVIDLFLNLLSHNSHLLRNLINCVFPHLCQYITPSAIHHILEVLDPKNENILSQMNEDSSDESDDDNESSSNKYLDNLEEEDEDDDIDEEKTDEMEDLNEDETVNDKLRMALHQVLSKNNGYQTDEESLDLDQMDETEGEELNKALGNVFKQYRPNKGKSRKQSRNEEALTHFRIRVLDLIEIYLGFMPSMMLTLETMLPLLQAIEFSIRDEHQQPLHNRLKSCLKKLTGLKEFSDADGVDEVVLHDLLKSLLDKGSRTSWITQDMGVQIADCCIFVIKCSDIIISLDQTPKKSRKKCKEIILEVMSNELEYYFHKRDSTTPIVLFKNIVRLCWNGIPELVAILHQYAFKQEIKPFKRTQALELLKLFYLNQRYLTTNTSFVQETLKDSHSQFSVNIISLFKSLCENPSEGNLKQKFICTLFNLLIAVKSCCLNVNIEWNNIADCIKDYRSNASFAKDAKSAYNKLCNRLGIPNNVVKKKLKLQNMTSSIVNEEKNVKRKVNDDLDNKTRKKNKVG